MPELIETPKLIQPREHKAAVVIWADLTVGNLDDIFDCDTPEKTKDVLADIFSLSDHAENQRTAILLDLYYYTIDFAKENDFTKEQTSAFFSIVKKTHEICIETPFGNVEQCFSYFKEALLCHAVKRPPFSINLFSAEEVKLITEYVINTYFRHYKMYKYAFTPKVRLDLTMNYSGMPSSPTPPPMEEDELLESGRGEGGDDSRSGGGGDATDRQSVTAGSEGGGDTQEEGAQPKSEESQKPDGKTQALSELKSLIKQELSEEIKKIKISLEDQIKSTEDTLNSKLTGVEGAQKGGRGSAKGRKK